jgi:hypothetical protein
MLLPAGVFARLAGLAVRAAIQLHHQPPLRAVEVGHVWAQGVLLAEFESLELDAPQ